MEVKGSRCGWVRLARVAQVNQSCAEKHAKSRAVAATTSTQRECKVKSALRESSECRLGVKGRIGDGRRFNSTALTAMSLSCLCLVSPFLASRGQELLSAMTHRWMMTRADAIDE